jgi:LysM repeat protein
MFQNLIKELPNLEDTTFENIFHIYQDKDEKYFYNLLNTIHIPQNLPDAYYTTYSVSPVDTWPLISYNVYNDTKLWWLILLTNNISNPTIPLKPGTELKILKTSIVSEILTELLTTDE